MDQVLPCWGSLAIGRRLQPRCDEDLRQGAVHTCPGREGRVSVQCDGPGKLIAACRLGAVEGGETNRAADPSFSRIASPMAPGTSLALSLDKGAAAWGPGLHTTCRGFPAHWNFSRVNVSTLCDSGCPRFRGHLVPFIIGALGDLLFSLAKRSRYDACC
jgi:hypothetical protein